MDEIDLLRRSSREFQNSFLNKPMPIENQNGYQHDYRADGAAGDPGTWAFQEWGVAFLLLSAKEVWYDVGL